MNYDKIKPEQLVSDTSEDTTKLANTLLDSFCTYIKYSHQQSPLARLYNMAVLIKQAKEIALQVHNEALDYVRTEQEDNTFSHLSFEQQQELAPVLTKDGIEYKCVQIANFRNMASKDEELKDLISKEQAAIKMVETFSLAIDKRIETLRASPEYKKHKPDEVTECLLFKDV